MNTDPSFGSWLKRHRKELGVTQDALASRLGCSLIALQKIEGGERHPSRQIALLLADYLQIPTDESEGFVAFARTGVAPDDTDSLSTAPQLPTGDQVGQTSQARQAPWRRAPAGKHNLPATLTRLIGREREVQAICHLLAQPRLRLLTLAGAPGIGKTRLALQVAQDLAAHFYDGAFLVDLSPVTDPELVLPTIAHALGLTDKNDQPLEALAKALRSKRLLLLLDNFEQVLDAAPHVVGLLEGSPWLKMLVTSREALHVRGERRFAVPPLQLPDPAHWHDLSALAHNPAIALFVERAQDVRPDFNLTKGNVADIIEICACLDGLPLPIELAATHSDLLSPHEIRVALSNRLSLLAGGYQDLPARQGTLRSAIEWSYDLLEPRERATFMQLSAFVGGGAREAVQAVCSLEGDTEGGVLESVALLVGKNLVKEERSGTLGEQRFTMLETLREYALERLRASGTEQDAWRLHAQHYLQFGERAGARVYEQNGAVWLDRLESEHDNLRAALGRSLDGGDSGKDDDERAMWASMGLHIAIATFPLWDARGYFSEGRDWFKRALLNAETLQVKAGDGALDLLRARALDYEGRLARYQGDYSTAQSCFEAGLFIYRKLGDSRGVALFLHSLAMLAVDHADYLKAQELCGESLSLSQETGDHAMQARTYNTLAGIYRNVLDFDMARTLYEKSLALYAELGDKAGLVMPLGNLALVALDQEDYAAARHYLGQSLPICRELGHKQNLAFALSNAAVRAVEERDYAEARVIYLEVFPLVRDLGSVMVAVGCMASLAAMCEQRGLPLEAAVLWGAVESHRESANLPMPVPGRNLYEGHLVSARAQVDSLAFDRAWAEGRAMPMDDVIARALYLLRSSQFLL